MIDKKIYDLDYIRELQARYKTDPGLLERVLYAFGLLEALVKVKHWRSVWRLGRLCAESGEDGKRKSSHCL